VWSCISGYVTEDEVQVVIILCQKKTKGDWFKWSCRFVTIVEQVTMIKEYQLFQFRNGGVLKYNELLWLLCDWWNGLNEYKLTYS
jgi:hypothetical protein